MSSISLGSEVMNELCRGQLAKSSLSFESKLRLARFPVGIAGAIGPLGAAGRELHACNDVEVPLVEKYNPRERRQGESVVELLALFYLSRFECGKRATARRENHVN